MHFGGNDDVKSAPIWQIAKRSNEQLPIDPKTENRTHPLHDETRQITTVIFLVVR